MKTEITYALSDLGQVVSKLQSLLNNCSVITFKGSLGAGKTTLIKALLAGLGVAREDITSPTFTYVNRYKLNNGKVCNHFDLYRLKDVGEFIAMGFDEYLNEPDSLTLIEWPEILLPLLNELNNACHISIGYNEDNTRTMTIISK